ncbi:MAG TPA: N-glycosylase/DNA lyase [Thermodesulfobacteriota bacterium]|nr:N-glycosylase/DNA lyase [Thermodesulfobacteriota bacterium]
MPSKTCQELHSSYLDKRNLIRSRLREFKQVFEQGDDRRVFEELVFCIFTANASAKMGIKAVDAVKDILVSAGTEELSNRLRRVHRFPNARARYIVHTREFLKRGFDFKLKDTILSFSDHLERRDFFAGHRDIKGIGYKEASHFLRNIGFSGYAILDKHILQSLYEFGVIENPKPPATRDKYLQIETKFKGFANKLEIDSDELDLLLWSEKTGEILK